MINKIIFKFIAISILIGCTSLSINKPTVNEYTLGEKWIWNWSRSVDGEVRAEGKDVEEVVKYKGVLGIWDGADTVKISSRINETSNKTPFRDWPLHIGKKWKYVSEWENNEGTKGKTSQDVDVVAFEMLQVEAGEFKAYKIEYKGLVTNSRGFKGDMTDTWWYCPNLKTYIKHVNNDGYGTYINELISYSKDQ